MAKNFYDQYYGNNLWRLPKSEIGPPPAVHVDKPWYEHTWARWLIQGVEAAVTAIVILTPGLDVSMPGVLAFDFAINEVGGSLQALMDEKSGHVSITNDLFYFGGPIASVLFGEAFNALKVAKNFESLENKFVPQLGKQVNKIAGKIEKIDWAAADSFKVGLQGAKYRYGIIPPYDALEAKIFPQLKTYWQRRAFGNFNKLQKSFIKELQIKAFSAARINLGKEFLYGYNGREALKEFVKGIESIEKFKFNFNAFALTEFADVGSVQADISKLDEPAIEARAALLAKRFGISMEEAKKIVRMLIENARKLTVRERNAIIREIYDVLVRAETASPGSNLIRGTLLNHVDEALQATEAEEMFATLFIGQYKQVSREFKELEGYLFNRIHLDLTPWQKFIKTSRSKGFKKVMNAVKWLRPSLAARKPINMAYRKLAKYFDKLFGEEITKEVKAISKLAKREIDKFIESGDAIPVESAWITNIRVLKPGIVHHTCLITFNPTETWNKEPVIVEATDKDIYRFVESPGKTYLDLWAISRGGKSTGLFGLLGIKFPRGKEGHIVSSIFGKIVNFLPIDTVRNILSMVSVFKHEVPKMFDGTYFSNYGKKFKSSLETYGIGRAARLVSRKILAKAIAHSGIFDKIAGKIFRHNIGTKIGLKAARREVNRFLGMEFQRMATATVSYGFKSMLKGKSFTKGMGQRLLTAGTRAMRDHLLHYNREITHGSAFQGVAVGNVRFQRKGKIYRRIPTTFMNARFKHKIHF